MNSSDTHFLNKNFCRDSKERFRNLLRSGAPDGLFWSPESPWHRLLHPDRTRVLCPQNLCADLCLKAKIAGLLSPPNRCGELGQR